MCEKGSLVSWGKNLQIITLSLTGKCLSGAKGGYRVRVRVRVRVTVRVRVRVSGFDCISTKTIQTIKAALIKPIYYSNY